MAYRWLCLGLIALALMSGGCNRPFREAPNPVEIDVREYDRMFQASVDVLREYGFRVNRQDRRFGRVTTHPLNSPTIFEPWRAYNTTAEQMWQSTFTNMQRTVTVFIEPKSPDSKPDGAGETQRPTRNSKPEIEAYSLRVEVLLENHQLPTRRMIPAQGGRMFSSLSEVPQRWQGRGIESSYWLPIGRDPYLEDRLIRDIVEQAMRY